MRDFVDWSYRSLRFWMWAFRALAAFSVIVFVVELIRGRFDTEALGRACGTFITASLFDALSHARRSSTVKVTLSVDDSQFREAAKRARACTEQLNRRLDAIAGIER